MLIESLLSMNLIENLFFFLFIFLPDALKYERRRCDGWASLWAFCDPRWPYGTHERKYFDFGRKYFRAKNRRRVRRRI